MKTYKIRNRYGAVHNLVVVDKNILKFYISSDCLCNNISGNYKSPTSIDPDGGPYIKVGHSPSQIFHEDLPNRKIVEIKPEADHYTLLLHDEDLVKGRTIKRKKAKR